MMSEGKRTIFLTVLETFLCCGTIFGWANLVKIFYEEGFYSEGRTDGEQKAELNSIFAIGSSLTSFGTIVFGAVFDKFGSFWTRTFAVFLCFIGNACLFLASPNETDILVTVGLGFVAVAGVTLLITQMQICNLFAESRGKVLSLCNGAMDSSSASALLLYSIYSWSGSYHLVWICFTSFLSLAIYRTMFVLPKTIIPYPLPDDYNHTPAVRNLCSNKTQSLDEFEEEKKELNPVKPNIDPFLSTKVLFSPLFWSNTIFFTIQVYRSYSYLALVTDSTAEIIQLAGDKLTLEEAQEEAGEMTKHFAYVQFFGVFIAFLNGFIIDKVIEKTNDIHKGLSAGVACTSSLGIAFSVLYLIPSKYAQYGTMIFSVFHRSCTFGINATVIAMSFPMEHFGKLYGIAGLGGVVASYAINLTINLLPEYGHFTVNKFILLLEIISFLHALVVLRYRNQKQ